MKAQSEALRDPGRRACHSQGSSVFGERGGGGEVVNKGNEDRRKEDAGASREVRKTRAKKVDNKRASSGRKKIWSRAEKKRRCVSVGSHEGTDE